MRYVPADEVTSLPVLELTRRNLETLLEKLDDPHSKRMLIDGDYKIVVKAVENEEHYADRSPGEIFTKGVRK